MTNIVNQLNQLLSDYQVYYQNLRGFHWNIKGRDFFELHEKFEELYNDTAVKIDEVAERILTLGQTPLHSYDDYTSTSKINPVKNTSEGETCVREIVLNLEYLVGLQKEIRKSAEDADDQATADQLATYVEEQEKTLWMYRSWLG